MAATDPDALAALVDALAARTDELERDHVKWLAVDSLRAEDRLSLLAWALVCLLAAGYFIGKAARADRGVVAGSGST